MVVGTILTVEQISNIVPINNTRKFTDKEINGGIRIDFSKTKIINTILPKVLFVLV